MVARAAVIGIGRIGFSYKVGGERASHVSSYLKCPRTELVAVADTDQAKLEAFKKENPDIAVYQDYETMLNREKPEIISICTPTPTHARIARNCARFNSTKVIFTEKPISSTVEDAERMIRTCEQFGVKLAVNHTRRWGPAYKLIKGILDKEWRNLPMSCVQGARTYREYAGWDIGELLAFDGKFSGDPIGDGVHMADLYNWYGQENTKPSLLNIPSPYLVFEIDLWGSNGLIRVLDNGAKIELFRPMESQVYGGFRELKHMAHLGVSYDFPSAMLNAVDDLVECAETDKRPECMGVDGLNALRMCLEKEETR